MAFLDQNPGLGYPLAAGLGLLLGSFYNVVVLRLPKRLEWQWKKDAREILELPEVYGVKENPLPWLQPLISGVEHANFFEARATEYSKAATRGQWHGAEGVWASFDRLQSQRTANTLPAE